MCRLSLDPQEWRKAEEDRSGIDFALGISLVH